MAEAPPLVPLENLFDNTTGRELPLPDALAALYGTLRFPEPPPNRPYVISNFVSSLDGVVSLGEPGTGGPDISGNSAHDRCVMGLLRAVADVVIVGAGTLRAFPRHQWIPEAIYSPESEAYSRLRTALGKTALPRTAIVTASGDLDLSLPVFTSDRAEAVVLTTAAGARALEAEVETEHSRTPVRVAGDGASLGAREIREALALPPGALILLECGPKLMGRFLEDSEVDELFLTLAPQIVGRSASAVRDSFVKDALFLPHRPLWTRLASLKRCESVLFLRYELRSGSRPETR